MGGSSAKAVAKRIFSTAKVLAKKFGKPKKKAEEQVDSKSYSSGFENRVHSILCEKFSKSNKSNKGNENG